MAKRKAKRGKKVNKKISILSVAGMSVPAMQGYTDFKTSGLGMAANNQVAYFSGFVPDRGVFEAQHLMKGAVPVAAGLLGSKIATKFGLNRALSSALGPLGKYIKL